VLVEGHDFNEPVADAVRANLDGLIVLSCQLAARGTTRRLTFSIPSAG
jgi:flagellum-specific ATP synthase